MKPGDPCAITLRRVRPGPHDPTLEAVVHLVDGEGRPLAFLFDGVIEGFAGWLPVVWRDGKAYTFLDTHVEVEAR